MANSTEGDSSDLLDVQQQQVTLRQHARLHWVHWVILSFSVVITILAWQFSSSLLTERDNSHFKSEAQRVVSLMSTRLAHYEDALFAGVASMLSHQGKMTREQWQQYATALNLNNRYPGVNGIGYIREVTHQELASFVAEQRLSWPQFDVHPKHNFPIRLPITYIEPATSNAAAIGLDIAFESNRREAALFARDRQETQISAPITLVQDTGKTPGFLFYAPVFLDGSGFHGLVYMPLVMKNLVTGILGNEAREIIFSIYDDDTLLYQDSDLDSKQMPLPVFSTSIDIPVFGRTWHYNLYNTPSFNNFSSTTQPMVVLVTGLIIDLMLFLLFLMITRTNHRVLDLAESMTTMLTDKNRVLTQKNNELESFAYIASHDLKTPIRAIHSLASFLAEDLNDQGLSAEAVSELSQHLDGINEQVIHSEALIQGVLNYSIVGHDTKPPELIDIQTLVKDIARSLSLSDTNMQLDANLPTFNTYTGQLKQVFENLIGNAIKYHPQLSPMLIAVSSEQKGDFYRFFVTDNGAGIDNQYHERIFKPFTTLQIQPSPDSSGIGLSIVKKSVEALGGQVGITSSNAAGTTFFFDWPILPPAHTEKLAHAA